jgi:hypothetical protein
VNILPGEPTKIPAKYQQSSTSGLEVDVPVDQSQIEYNIDIRTNGITTSNSVNVDVRAE